MSCGEEINWMKGSYVKMAHSLEGTTIHFIFGYVWCRPSISAVFGAARQPRAILPKFHGPSPTPCFCEKVNDKCCFLKEGRLTKFPRGDSRYVPSKLPKTLLQSLFGTNWGRNRNILPCEDRVHFFNENAYVFNRALTGAQKGGQGPIGRGGSN